MSVDSRARSRSEADSSVIIYIKTRAGGKHTHTTLLCCCLNADGKKHVASIMSESSPKLWNEAWMISPPPLPTCTNCVRRYRTNGAAHTKDRSACPSTVSWMAAALWGSEAFGVAAAALGNASPHLKPANEALLGNSPPPAHVVGKE